MEQGIEKYSKFCQMYIRNTCNDMHQNKLTKWKEPVGQKNKGNQSVYYTNTRFNDQIIHNMSISEFLIQPCNINNSINSVPYSQLLIFLLFITSCIVKYKFLELKFYTFLYSWHCNKDSIKPALKSEHTPCTILMYLDKWMYITKK